MANVLFPSASSQKVANVWGNAQALADEGSFYVATNATPLTAIAMVTSVIDDNYTQATTHAQASPLLYINNQGAASSPTARTIFLRYLRLLQPVGSQAWTSCTSAHYTLRIDSLAGRYTSGGTAITPVNINPTGAASAAQIYFGANAVTIPSTNQKLVGRGQIQGTIPLAGDQWFFTFGDLSGPTNLLGASAIKNITIPCGPVMIPPGWNFQLGIFGVALAAAPAFEFELGYAERLSGQ
jgi:hypothetical protein